MNLSYRYGDDPYYVSPQYEQGAQDASKRLGDLCDCLATAVDELAAYINRLDETFGRDLTPEETKLVALGTAVLARFHEER